MRPIQFIEEDHKFIVDGSEKPSVTRLLKDEGFVPYTTSDKWYSEFGVISHSMINLDLKNDLDTSSIPKILIPTFQQWEKFKADYKHLFPVEDAQGLLAERPMYHDIYDYCGIPDLPLTDGSKIFLFDVKNSKHYQRYWDLQVVGYDALIRRKLKMSASEKILKFALMLPRGENYYKTKPLNDPTAEAAFKAATITWHYKNSNKLHKLAA